MRCTLLAFFAAHACVLQFLWNFFHTHSHPIDINILCWVSMGCNSIKVHRENWYPNMIIINNLTYLLFHGSGMMQNIVSLGVVCVLHPCLHKICANVLSRLNIQHQLDLGSKIMSWIFARHNNNNTLNELKPRILSICVLLL